MSVDRLSVMNSSCASPGCACRERMPRYPSDLTDEQWTMLEPEARAVMAELTRAAGRPMVHDLRAMVDAIGYVVRYSIEWRALPADFPPHQAVYAFFCRWSARGLPQRLADRLRGRIRIATGRAELPTAGSIDSQTVKAADTVGAATRGFDGGKKINGRKRHVAVDCLGLLLIVVVTAASVQDRDGACPLLALLRERFSSITLIWADGGYAGRLVTWAAQVLRLTVTIIRRSDDAHGFEVLPRRWVVERTFGWMMRYQRLVRDYERKPENHEAMVWWATIAIMTRRLTRELAQVPPNPDGARNDSPAHHEPAKRPGTPLPTGSETARSPYDQWCSDPGGRRAVPLAHRGERGSMRARGAGGTTVPIDRLIKDMVNGPMTMGGDPPEERFPDGGVTAAIVGNFGVDTELRDGSYHLDRDPGHPQRTPTIDGIQTTDLPPGIQVWLPDRNAQR